MGDAVEPAAERRPARQTTVEVMKDQPVSEQHARMTGHSRTGAGEEHIALLERAGLPCIRSQASPGSILILGDSHARDFREAAKRAFPSADFVMAHQSSCVPAEGAGKKGYCFPGLTGLLERLRSDTPITKIILDARWGNSEYKKIAPTTEELKRLGFSYLIVGPTPLYPTRIADYMRADVWSGKTIDQTARISLQNLMFDWQTVEHDLSALGGSFLPVMSYFCTSEGCKYLTEDNHPVYWDREHFTLPGINSLAAKLRNDTVASSFVLR